MPYMSSVPRQAKNPAEAGFRKLRDRPQLGQQLGLGDYVQNIARKLHSNTLKHFWDYFKASLTIFATWLGV